jgi:hypothetical protein
VKTKSSNTSHQTMQTLTVSLCSCRVDSKTQIIDIHPIIINFVFIKLLPLYVTSSWPGFALVNFILTLIFIKYICKRLLRIFLPISFLENRNYNRDVSGTSCNSDTRVVMLSKFIYLKTSNANLMGKYKRICYTKCKH